MEAPTYNLSERAFPILTLSLNVDIPTNVETPDTFTLSNSVCPSTSKSALASILPPKVETPDISNCFANRVVPVTVAIPVTVKLSSTFVSPVAESSVRSPVAVSISPSLVEFAILISPICASENGFPDVPI